MKPTLRKRLLYVFHTGIIMGIRAHASLKISTEYLIILLLGRNSVIVSCVFYFFVSNLLVNVCVYYIYVFRLVNYVYKNDFAVYYDFLCDFLEDRQGGGSGGGGGCGGVGGGGGGVFRHGLLYSLKPAESEQPSLLLHLSFRHFRQY